jgi:transposase
MVGVSRVVIHESVDELKVLMHQQVQSGDQERVHLLYLLKSEQAQSVTHAAALLGRGRITVQRWLLRYEETGISGLLHRLPRTGRPCGIPEAAQAELIEKLSTPSGFGGYEEIRDWLKQDYQHEISYEGIHAHVRYRLKAKPKRARPVSTEQDPQKVALFKTS